MMNHTLYSLALLAAALGCGTLLNLIIAFAVRHNQKMNFIKEVQIFLNQLQGPVKVLVLAVCVASVLPFLRFSQNVHGVLGYAVSLIVVAGLGWLAVTIVHAVRDIILSRYDIRVKDNLRARRIYTQIRVMENMITVVIILLTIALMLLVSPRVRQIGVSLLASAGVMGIILGFAAQKTLGNFIAGIQLAFAQPIRIDDVVVVENEWGWIEEISLTYVVVRIWDLRRLVVPISYFIEKPFQNWTRVSADILGSVFLYADYTVPVEALRQELTRILEASPSWDKKVNSLQVTGAKESTVELRALMSAADSPTVWNLRCEVREKLLAFLQKNHPQSLPKVRVEMEKSGPKESSAPTGPKGGAFA
ncbi:MAG TPA: mechanosensitive ion channel family protein [Candidatus Bathyarchaeia archaeon]|nr:mechanosensitive ion channel family protein [Candidatus Bathyarchaeia archaeon]